MKVLVTGASGFLGGWVAQKLSERVGNPFRLAQHSAPTEGVGLLSPELRWGL